MPDWFYGIFSPDLISKIGCLSLLAILSLNLPIYNHFFNDRPNIYVLDDGKVYGMGKGHGDNWCSSDDENMTFKEVSLSLSVFKGNLI